MIGNLKSKEELEAKKLKVTKADIVVRGTIDKPYYAIVYHEVGKDYDNEGFGSYYLENVFKWREEDFEIVDEKEQPQAEKWILCEVAMPKEHDSMFAKLKGTDKWRSAMFEKTSDEVNVTVVDQNGKGVTVHAHTIDGEWSCGLLRACKQYRIIAWKPLPQPYKKDHLGEVNGMVKGGVDNE